MKVQTKVRTTERKRQFYVIIKKLVYLFASFQIATN